MSKVIPLRPAKPTQRQFKHAAAGDHLKVALTALERGDERVAVLNAGAALKILSDPGTAA